MSKASEGFQDNPQLAECGICGQYHPEGFQGDCRDDDNRYPHADALSLPCGCESEGWCRLHGTATEQRERNA